MDLSCDWHDVLVAHVEDVSDESAFILILRSILLILTSCHSYIKAICKL